MEAHQPSLHLDNTKLLSLIEVYYKNNENALDLLNIINELRFGNSFFYIQTLNQEEEDERRVITGEIRYSFQTNIFEEKLFQLVFTSEELLKAFMNDPTVTYKQFSTIDLLNSFQTTIIEGILIDVHSDSQIHFYRNEIIQFLS